MIKSITKKKIGVNSLISPIYDLAIMKLLHKRYSALGKFQSSCSCLDAGYENRWCFNCADCFRIFTYLKALGVNPKLIGFKKDMLDKKHIKVNFLYNHKEKDRYEKAGDDNEIIYGLYLAYKNGAKGYSIDWFKKNLLDYAKENEDKFYKKFFGLHNMQAVPRELRTKLKSILKEGLNI